MPVVHSLSRGVFAIFCCAFGEYIMPRNCCLIRCVKSKKERESIISHRFPVHEARRESWVKWVELMNGRPFEQKTRSEVCSLHFCSECYRPSGHLKNDAVPSIPPKRDPVNEFRFGLVPKLDYLEKPADVRNAPDVTATEQPFPAVGQGDSEVNINVTSRSNQSVLGEHFYTMEPLDLSKERACNDGEKIQSTPECLQRPRRKRSIDQLSPRDFKSPKRARRRLLAIQSFAKEKRSKVKILQQKCRRAKKKILSLQSLVRDLKDKRLVSNELALMLRECFSPPVVALIERGLKMGNVQRMPISPELRQFALTLNYHSNAAYEYVRDSFMKKALPHPKTLSKWFAGIDAKPGFTKEALASVKAQVEVLEKEGKKLLCALMVDEMAIRKALELVGNKTYGYADNGTGVENDSAPLAGEAWVFMLVAINGHWKIPIGYFLIHSMDAAQRANVVRHALNVIHDTGANVCSITFDGNNTNIAMVEELGACLKPLSAEWKPFFSHAETGQVVYVILDPAHMIKLWRNTLGGGNVQLKDSNGEGIHWYFIQRLHNLQMEEGLSSGNRIGKRHMQYVKEKMKVSLAAQTLSASVADALVYCERDLRLPQFRGCGATVQFIRHADKIFDILNSRNIRAKKQFKAPLSERNILQVREYWVEAKAYIKGLTTAAGRPILATRWKTGFLGFITAMESALALFDTWITGGILVFLPTYKLSQDHLEVFFSALRARGRFSNNPTVRQLIAAYKRLLVQVQLGGRKGANCWPLDCTTILHVTCTSDKRGRQLQGEDGDEIAIRQHNFELPMLDTVRLSQYVTDVIEYIAGFVSRSLGKSTDCVVCRKSLFGTVTTSSLLRRKNRGGLKIPSSDVLLICKKTEEEVRCSKSKRALLTTELDRHIINVKRRMQGSTLFESLNDHVNEQEPFDNHRQHLIHKIVKKFLVIRVTYDIKKLNLSMHKERIRTHCNKTVLFQHQ